MSKAFLFVALTLIIACATAAHFTLDKTIDTATVTDCASIGFSAAGSFWINVALDAAADFKTNPSTKPCADALDAATITYNAVEYTKTDADACFAAAAKIGAAVACGLAKDATCSDTLFCAADLTCSADKKCAETVTPSVVISQARYTLQTDKKLKDLESYISTAKKDSKNSCIGAYSLIAADAGRVVLQLEAKTGDDVCDAEATARAADTKFTEIAKIDSTFTVVVEGTVADCVVSGKIQCVAQNAKCVGVTCAKNTACTAANQVQVCASGKCEVETGNTEGKCNSASVVGYVVAIVAVVAVFVF